MELYWLAECLVLLVVVIVSSESQTLCADGLTELSVSSAAEAAELSNALLCSGSGQFEVDWSGNVLVSTTFAISNGTSLKVTGVGAAVIDGGGMTQLFAVEGGAFL